MRVPWRLLAVLAAVAPFVRGVPIAAAGGDVPVQPDFDATRFYGKWYSLVLGTTCHWMVQYKDRFAVGTMVVGPGRNSDDMHITATRIRQGLCRQVSVDYQKTGVPGKVAFYNPKWKASIEYYVAHTDYEKFTYLVIKKNSTHGVTISATLYGRSPDLPDPRLAAFRQFALDLGIPEDSIFTLKNKGECLPPETPNKPQRVQRSVLGEDEGSADGALPGLPGKKEGDCLERMDPGPCLGMLIRYFYNTSSQTCQGFVYGGCMGNNNNFASERACLQTCRTEAACRLPVAPGSPCQSQFWAFDAQQGKCVTFAGCGSNANKFYLEKECNEYCGVLQDGDDEFLRLAPAQ